MESSDIKEEEKKRQRLFKARTESLREGSPIWYIFLLGEGQDYYRYSYAFPCCGEILFHRSECDRISKDLFPKMFKPVPDPERRRYCISIAD